MHPNAVGLTLCRKSFGRTYFTTQCLGFVLFHSAADAVATKNLWLWWQTKTHDQRNTGHLRYLPQVPVAGV